MKIVIGTEALEYRFLDPYEVTHDWWGRVLEAFQLDRIEFDGRVQLEWIRNV